MVIDIFWKLWPQLPCYGRKAAQFVDLLGYFTMKTSVDEKRIQTCVEEAVGVLKSQNLVLASHPNSNIYGRLTQLVEFNGY
jgi:E3 ubiquitin-protein ligase UBR4